MGIFDGITGGQGGLTREGDEYERLMMQNANQYAAQKAQYMQAYGSGTQRIQAVKRFNPNESEAFQVPMSQLVTMWRLKYGDEWVDMQQSRPSSGKDFYTDAFDRLDRAGLFEMFDGWCRLKEDA